MRKRWMMASFDVSMHRNWTEGSGFVLGPVRVMVRSLQVYIRYMYIILEPFLWAAASRQVHGTDHRVQNRDECGHKSRGTARI